MSFTIKQGRFEGPYHKLLELIENRKLSINEISLAQIADEYISYIKSLKESTNESNINNKDDISQFIVVASTLMIIKAKSLLPTIEYSREEKAEINNLEYKLLLYKVLVDGAREIKKVWHKSKWSKARSKISNIVFSPGNIKSITLQSISILTIVKLPHLERLRNVAVQQAIKIEHIIEGILDHMRNITNNFSLNLSTNNEENNNRNLFNFKDMANHIYDKYKDLKDKLNSTNKIEANNKKSYAIVSFLAILDMIRNNILVAENKNGDIEIKKL